MKQHPLDRDRIGHHVSTIFADDLHAKRVASLANAAVGGRRVSERRVTDALAVIAPELAVALAGVPVSPDGRPRKNRA